MSAVVISGASCGDGCRLTTPEVSESAGAFESEAGAAAATEELTAMSPMLVIWMKSRRPRLDLSGAIEWIAPSVE